MLTAVPSEIAQYLSEQHHYKLTGFSFSGGGCINHGGRLKTTAGDFFLKWNDAAKFPGMFKAEAEGLNLLRKPTAINIPAVIISGESGHFQFLLLEYVESASASPNYWRDLGHRLASLHKISAASFGLGHDNYIGSLHQYNKQSSSWIDFFISERLDVQLKLAFSKRLIDSQLIKQFEEIYKMLPQLLPEEKPALLHGDLWSGNLMINNKGEPCLIDPAVYYGHREAEIAFTQLFGGFSSEFYMTYHESFPLQNEFEQRADIYNLYPLLVHANLFGASYVQQIKSVIRRFQ